MERGHDRDLRVTQTFQLYPTRTTCISMPSVLTSVKAVPGGRRND